MPIRLAVALVAGLLTALVVAGLPASAADQPIAASSAYNAWSPSDVTINPGDSVTWSTDGVNPHNVCVAKLGQDGTACSASSNEFRNGDVSASWATYANSHTFNTPGTYQFICEAHASLGMKGTITVRQPGTATTAPETITDTITTPTQTTPTQTTPAPDTTAPTFTGKPRRRSSRRALILQVGSSEDGKLEVTVSRRAPRRHSFGRVGQASLSVKAGRNKLTVPRKASGRMRSGAYRVKLVLVDAAGNRSGTRILVFKLA